MIPRSKEEINRLQDNLQTIRLAGGWSTAAFADLLGVSKQTVCNLESQGAQKTMMNKLQYIGIRSILDYEIEHHPENKVLSYTVHTLLNKENPTEEDRKKVKQAVAYASGAKATGLDATMIAAGLATIIGTAALSNPAIIAATSKWLSDLMKPKK